MMYSASDSWLLFLTALIGLIIGYLSSVPCSTGSGDAFVTRDKHNLQVGFRPPPRSTSKERISKEAYHDSIFLEEQTTAAAEFQQFIRRQQEIPSDCSRILILVTPYKSKTRSWIDSLELIARALKVALSTERRLVLSASGTTEYDGNDSSICNNLNQDSYCQFVAVINTSSCPPLSGNITPNPESPQRQQTRKNDVLKLIESSSPLRRGIQDSNSDFFNSQYYGPESVVALPNVTTWPWPKSWLIDAGLAWDRPWGAFWVRSQILLYLYDSSMTTRNTHVRDLNSADNFGGSRTVTLVWDLDAQQTARHSFGRDSIKTHAWDRILAIGNHIRSEHIKTGEEWMFALAVVPSTVVQEPGEVLADFPSATFEGDGWTIVIWEVLPDKEELATEKQLLKAIASSDFLIGSFASPWFRVSAALHMSESILTRSLRRQQHWSLDIEWVEAVHTV